MKVRVAGPILLIALAVSVFHYRGIAPGRTFLPVDFASTLLPWGPPHSKPRQNYLVTDPLFQFYPFLDFSVRCMREGSWPLWNPYIFTGHPCFADPLAQTFYPPFALLGVVLGTARGIAIGLYMHAVLAALFTYGLLRSLGCTRPASLAGAWIYALGGFMVTWFETLFWTSTLTWLPAVLWMFELSIARRSTRFAALGALAFGAAFLGGQLTFAVSFGLFLGLYAVGRTVELARRRDARRRWPVPAAVIIVFTGTLLAAILLVPFAEILPLTARTLEEGLRKPLHASQLMTLLLPEVFGTPLGGQAYWGQSNYSEGTIYAGIPAVVLAVLALACARERRFFVGTLFGLAVLTIYFALRGPGVGLLASVPVIKYLSLTRSVFLLPLILAMLAALTMTCPRIPARFSLIAGCGVACVTGLFLVFNAGTLGPHGAAIAPGVFHAAVVLVLTLGFLLAGQSRPRAATWAAWGLAILVFADLYKVGAAYNPVGRIRDLTPPRPSVDFLKEHAGSDRVAPLIRGSTMVFGPNLASTMGLAEPGGYSSVVPGFLRALFEKADPNGHHWYLLGFHTPTLRVLDLLNVRFLIASRPLNYPPGGLFRTSPGQAAPVGSWREVFSGEVTIYERTSPMPRAFLIYDVMTPPAGQGIPGMLLDLKFDIRRTAIVSGPLLLPSAPPRPASPAAIAEYTSTKVVLRAKTKRKALLVLSDQYHPGWRAFVDGRETPVLRVNGCFRGVVVTPGAHEVVFRFQPASLKRGAAISLVSALVLLFCAALDPFGRRARRREPRSTATVPGAIRYNEKADS